MGRSLDLFLGKNAIIGCSEKHDLCDHTCHPYASFFSFDMDPDVDPDYKFDIREDLPAEFKKRFHITLVENVDWYAYNDTPDSYPNRFGYQGHLGFKNIWEMTDDKGFVFISGCPRQQEFRNSIQALKYIELSRESSDFECVIIPKDQNLSLDEINQQIRQDPDLSLMIAELNQTIYIPKEQQFSFPDIPYSDFSHFQNRVYFQKQLSAEELAFLEKHQALAEVQRLYKAIENLEEWERQNQKPNVFWLPNIQLSRNLRKLTDSFFKNDTRIVRRDIAIFQKKFNALVKKEVPSLIQKKSDYLLILANILIALTGVGAIAVGAKIVYSQQTCGRNLPLFFNSSDKEKLIFKMRNENTNLNCCPFSSHNHDTAPQL